MVKHTPYWFIYIFRGSNHHAEKKWRWTRRFVSSDTTFTTCVMMICFNVLFVFFKVFFHVTRRLYSDVITYTERRKKILQLNKQIGKLRQKLNYVNRPYELNVYNASPNIYHVLPYQQLHWLPNHFRALYDL